MQLADLQVILKVAEFRSITAVVETGSFAAAARKLNSSRSRVSEQVANLESGMGVRLLQRSTR